MDHAEAVQDDRNKIHASVGARMRDLLMNVGVELSTEQQEKVAAAVVADVAAPLFGTFIQRLGKDTSNYIMGNLEAVNAGGPEFYRAEGFTTICEAMLSWVNTVLLGRQTQG